MPEHSTRTSGIKGVPPRHSRMRRPLLCKNNSCYSSLSLIKLNIYFKKRSVKNIRNLMLCFGFRIWSYYTTEHLSSKLARRDEIDRVLNLNFKCERCVWYNGTSVANKYIASRCRNLIISQISRLGSVHNKNNLTSNTTTKLSNFRKLRDDSKIKISAAGMERPWCITYTNIVSKNSWARKML